MSFCRWSTDDYLCDLYCYESDEGFETHVANRRRVYKTPLPDKIVYSEATSEAFLVRHMTVGEYEEGKDFEYVPVGLEHNGESFVDSSMKEFIETLKMLKAAGYRFPFELIEELS